MTKPKDKLILIVEDDDTVLEFLEFAIQSDGFRTACAKDGIKAMEVIGSSKPDLIVLDMMIPQKSGFEVIKMLQTNEYCNIPIIVITGRLIDDNFRQMIRFESNVKEYIVKPIKAEYLLYKMHTLLGTVSPFQETAQDRSKSLKEKLKPKESNENPQ